MLVPPDRNEERCEMRSGVEEYRARVWVTLFLVSTQRAKKCWFPCAF